MIPAAAGFAAAARRPWGAASGEGRRACVGLRIGSSIPSSSLAALFVGIVAADVFVSILLRYFFGISIPDSYDFGRLLLGMLIFWGIGATSYRGTHITVDLLWANVGPKYQRAIDIFATLVLLFVVAVQTFTLYDKVWTTRADNVLTFDLRLPTWPFFLLAWLGDVSAVS